MFNHNVHRFIVVLSVNDSFFVRLKRGLWYAKDEYYRAMVIWITEHHGKALLGALLFTKVVRCYIE